MNLKLTLVRILCCCSIIGLFSGCSSIMCGPRQSVSIGSKPTGAEVIIYDSRGEIVNKETTPCTVSLSRQAHEWVTAANYVVLVRKEGYAPVQVPLTGCVNRAYYANIMNGGIGYIVDPMTGCMWSLYPPNVDTKLANENAAFLNHKGEIFIVLKEQVPHDLLSYLEPIKN